MGFQKEIEAESRAKEIRMTMDRPERWAIRVWQNDGWNYNLECRNVSVAECLREGDFFALVSDKPNVAGVGLAGWTNNGNRPSHTAQEAVDFAIENVVTYIEKLTEAAEAAAEGLSRE